MISDKESAEVNARWRTLRTESSPDEVTLKELDSVGGDVTYSAFWAASSSVESIVASIEQHFKCVKGRPFRICETGEDYVEFSEAALCRDTSFDREVVKRAALSRIAIRLSDYLTHPEGETHTVYWRIPLEEEWIDAPQVAHYDDNGPDVDFYTQRSCVLDRDWKRYGVYCRLLRSDKPVKEFV